MGDFKVGDLVKISNPLGICKKYKDTIHTVTSIDNQYVYLDVDDDIKYCRAYLPYELEHVDGFEEFVEKVKDVHENGASFEFRVDDEELKKWFVSPTTFINTDEDCLDAFRYAMADFKTIDKYIKNEEEINMNKVLRLWNDRQIESIDKKYDELMKEYIEKHYEITSRYKELIETFEKDLEDLYKEENENKESESSILKENSTCNVYKYVVDEDSLRYEAVDLYREDKAQELDKQADKFKEIDALLSMSEDLEYQQEILVEYGIINKKTKRMI